jgi:beta-lactamase superfamily II metal-dependent hydrolase
MLKPLAPKNRPQRYSFVLGLTFAILLLSGCQPSSSSSSSLVSLTSEETPSSSTSSETLSSSPTSSTSISAPSPSSHALQVYALEQTGQYGDCTLFKSGDYEILIDGGNQTSAPQLKEALSTYVTDHILDLLIITHPHSDHYGGFTYGQTSPFSGGTLSDGGITSVGKIVDSGIDSTSVSYYGSSVVRGFRNYWVNKGAEYSAISTLVEGHTYDALWSLTDALSVQWLDTGNYAPAGGSITSGDLNDYSVACDIRFGSYDFFMAGDLPSAPEDDLVAKYRDNSFLKAGNQVIYKACHHGSNGANDSTLISFLSPSYAWASAGITDTNNTLAGIKSSQHPYKTARSRIETSTGKDKMWWNGTAGTLEMSIPEDYSSFSIKGVGRQYEDYYVGGSLVARDSETNIPLELTQWAALNF